MSVRINKQGRYLVDCIWPDGIRTRSVMPDEKTAEHINKKIEVATVDEDRIWRKLRKELRLEKNQVLTFGDLADQYFEKHVKLYNRDIRVKQSRLEALKIFFANRPIDSIGPQSVGTFIASKRRDGVKNATVNRYIAVLKHMMTWAVRQGVLEADPLLHVEKLEEPEWIGTRPDGSLIDKIFSNLDPQVVPIFVFLRETGCRRGEAISLNRSQLDFARQAATFHGETKNGRARQVPLTDKAVWSVQALPARGPYVFNHPETLKPYKGDELYHLWEKAREGAGCTSLRIHDLRHAFAIGLAEEGCPMHYISEVLGHHSIEFTRRRYARFSPESATRAVLRVLQGRKTEVVAGA